MRELEELKQMGLVATSTADGLLERLKRSYLSKNSFPFPMTTGCCALEIKQASLHETIPFPEQVDGPTLEESDLLIVSGHLNFKWALMLKKAYEMMVGPKWVMAVGSCACSGAVFEGHTSIPGLAKIIPVDVYVPGCPPTPQDIIRGLEEVNKRISLGLCASEEVVS